MTTKIITGKNVQIQKTKVPALNGDMSNPFPYGGHKTCEMTCFGVPVQAAAGQPKEPSKGNVPPIVPGILPQWMPTLKNCSRFLHLS